MAFTCLSPPEKRCDIGGRRRDNAYKLYLTGEEAGSALREGEEAEHNPVAEEEGVVRGVGGGERLERLVGGECGGGNGAGATVGDGAGTMGFQGVRVSGSQECQSV